MGITSEEILEFVKTSMKGSPLKATQKNVSAVRIKFSLYKLNKGERPPSITVKDNMIINGHHRYIAGMIFNSLPDIVPGECSTATKETEWSEVNVILTGWGYN